MPLSAEQLDAAFGAPQRAAKTLAGATQDASPDDAARALQLSKDTGVPSHVIDAGLEQFESAYRSKLSADIIHDEPHLQDYINDNPVHAKVSNDDWGGLANLAGAMQRYRGLQTTGSMIHAFSKGFNVGYGEEPWGGWFDKTVEREGLAVTPLARWAWKGLGLPLELTGRGLSGLVQGTRGAALSFGQSMGMSEQEAERFGRDIAGMAEMQLMGTGVHGVKGPAAPKPPGVAKPPGVQVTLPRTGQTAFEPLAPYLRAGEKPPLGVHPLVDQALKAEAQEHAKLYDDLNKAHDASATMARSPEAAERFYALRPEGGMIRLTADGLRRVYDGESRPEVGDGKLGDLAGVADDFDAAIASGTSVSIPLGEWMTKVSPELRKDLRDDLVHTEGGISINEGKEYEPISLEQQPIEQEGAPPGGQTAANENLTLPLRSLKAAAGLKPVPDKTIGKVAEEAVTKGQMKLLEPKIAAEQQAEADWINRQAEKRVRKEQTKEWKEKAAEVRKQVLEEVDNRPDVAADKLLREGYFVEGNIRRTRSKINADFLTEEQRAGIDPDFVSEGKGYDPDELATALGYPTGDALLRDLAEAEEVRRQHGLGPEAWRSAIVESEVMARMEKEFGSLEENILEEVKDHIVSPEVMDRLHEELVRLGMEAGTKPDSKAGIKKWVEQVFNDSTSGNHSVRKYQDAMGKSGRAAEKALLEGKFTEAFQHKQAQFIAQHFMKQSMALEKVQAKLERIIKQYGTVKKDDTRLSPEHRNLIHQILDDAGQPTGWLRQNLDAEIAQRKHKNLEAFQEARFHAGSQMDIAGWLMEHQKFDPKKLSVTDFRDFVSSLSDIVADGRAVKEVYTTEGKEEFAVAYDQIQDQFVQFKIIKKSGEPTRLRKIAEVPKAAYARSIVLENLFNRIQLDDPHGPFNRYIVFPLSRGAAEFYKLDRETLPKMINENWKKFGGDMKKKVENDFWINPHTGDPIIMDRGMVRALLQYRGERTAWDKMTRGWDVNPDRAHAWLEKHSTVEDVEWAQGQGEIFAHLKDLDDAKRRDRGFTPVQNLVLTPFEMHGKTFEGWYQPMIYHPEWLLPRSKIADEAAFEAARTSAPEDRASRDSLFNDQYTRAGMARRWDNKRTQYARPTNLDLAATAPHMGKMARDIAMRDSLTQAAKFFYDARFKTELTRRFGPEWTALLEPYLKSITNQDNVSTKNAAKLEQVMDAARASIMTFEIGLKGTTFLKHVPGLAMNSLSQIGPKEFALAVKDIFHADPETGEANWRTVLEKSAETRNRLGGHYQETVTGAQKSGLEKRTLRDFLADISTKPLAVGDTLFTVPMWFGAYRQALREMEGKPEIAPEAMEARAVDIAERAVRQSHGSLMLTAKPEMISNASAFGRWFTSFYGVYSHFLQRALFEAPWRIADTFGLRFVGQLEKQRSSWGRLAALTASYVVFPVAMEMAVEGELRELFGGKEEKTPYIYRGLQSLGLHVAGMMPGVRDLARYAIKGGEPSMGLLGAGYHAVNNLVQDVKKGQKSLQGPALVQTMAHVAQAIGTTQGVPTDQMIRTTKFLEEYSAGREHPRGISPFVPGTWSWGLLHGTAKERKHR